MPHGGNRKTDQDPNLDLEHAADLLKVSRANAAKAKAFLANADTALVKLVEEPGSKLSLDAACKVAELSGPSEKSVSSTYSNGGSYFQLAMAQICVMNQINRLPQP